MNSANKILHQIADPALTPNERARLRCQLAKQLEEVGNYEAAREAMGELWRGVGHHPMVDELDQTTTAEVILRSDVLTGWIGSSRQIFDSQETAKNLISESMTIFEAARNAEKIAEAEMELGYCYWREGAFNEARDVQREALSRLVESSGELKIVTLLRLAIVERAAKRLNDAYHILTVAATLIDSSGNDILKGKFHNQFATILENLGRAERSQEYIDRALIEYAASSYHFEQAGHTRYQACVENNLGFLFGTIRRFREAHEHLDLAQALFTQLKDQVHLAQVDDARAKVLLEEGRIAESEKLARYAVYTLEKGGEQSLYAEALTTHGIALARLGQHEGARLTLQKAIEIAQNAGDTEDAGLAALGIIEELGDHLTVDDLSATYERALELLGASRNMGTQARLSACAAQVLSLAGILPSPQTWENFSLKEALRRYEARIIERALKDAGGVVTRAAHMLGFKHHTSLINRLNSRQRELLGARTPVETRRRSLIFVGDHAMEAEPYLVLHVEDSDIVAGAVKAILEAEGWTVESFRDGISALAAISELTPYDVLVFDNEVPGMNGIELIIQTRLLPTGSRRPSLCSRPAMSREKRGGPERMRS